MHTTRTWTATIALSACVLAALPAAGAGDRSPAVRTFEITYRATVEKLPADAAKVAVWIPYPTSDDAQEVSVTDIEAPYPTRVAKEPEFGDSILYMEADHPGAGPLQVVIKARVRRSEVLRKDYAAARPHHGELPAAVAKWLEPDRLVPLDRRIRDLAAKVTRGKDSDLAKARAIYDYVVDTMSYDKSGTGWGHGDIYWACDAKRGNCTDFHALFTGLSRAVGIPARFAIGLPIPADRGEGKVAGYHCWAAFYLDGYGWVPVDASEARKHPDKRDYYFGAYDEDRVELSQGRDITLVPRQAGEPLNFFVYPYVEVDGKPWKDVEKGFFYRDLAGGEAAGR